LEAEDQFAPRGVAVVKYSPADFIRQARLGFGARENLLASAHQN
jgi:hypothetical protein